MNIVILDPPGDSSTVYTLMSLLEDSKWDSNILYEIHDSVGKSEPSEIFIERSKRFYKAFADSSQVDRWGSDYISYAAYINSTWFIAKETGSNTYIGSGPGSTLNMREFCSNRKIKLLYIEGSVDHFIKKTSGIDLNSSKKEKETIADFYQKSNSIIKKCGEGLSRIIDTAEKLHEPNYRDLFLAAFNSHNYYIVDAESKNRKGRSDLKVCCRAIESCIIYEFKVLKKNEGIKEAIIQVTDRYASQTNRYNGIVFINKINGDLSEILKTIKQQMQESHMQILDIRESPDKHKIEIKHTHKRDKHLTCYLTIFLIDIQP